MLACIRIPVFKNKFVYLSHNSLLVLAFLDHKHIHGHKQFYVGEINHQAWENLEVERHLVILVLERVLVGVSPAKLEDEVRNSYLRCAY